MNTTDDTGSGGGLTSDGGTVIEWQRVVTVGAGVVSASFFDGVADVIGSTIEWLVTKPVAAVGTLTGSAVRSLLGFAPGTIDGSWRAATSFIDGLGPLAWLAALAVVLATAYGVATIYQEGA